MGFEIDSLPTRPISEIEENANKPTDMGGTTVVGFDSLKKDNSLKFIIGFGALTLVGVVFYFFTKRN